MLTAYNNFYSGVSNLKDLMPDQGGAHVIIINLLFQCLYLNHPQATPFPSPRAIFTNSSLIAKNAGTSALHHLLTHVK